MSQIDTSAVERYMTCLICRNFLREPKWLPCGHPFCRNCLHRYYISRENQTNECACPTCRKNFVLDYSGVDSLPTFFQAQAILSERSIDNAHNNKCEKCGKGQIISSCKTCRQDICRKCVKTHEEYEELNKHEIVPLTGVQSGKQNRRHRFERKKDISQEDYDELMKMKHELDRLQIQMECSTKTAQNAQIHLRDEREKSKSEIKGWARCLKDKVEEEEKKMIDQLNNEFQSEQERHSQDITKLESMTKDVKDLIGNIMPKLCDEPEPPDGPDMGDITRAHSKVLYNWSKFTSFERENEIIFLPDRQTADVFKFGEIKLKSKEAPPHKRSFNKPVHPPPCHQPVQSLSSTLPCRKVTVPRSSSARRLSERTHIGSSPPYVSVFGDLDASPRPCVPRNINRCRSFSSKRGKISGITITSDSNIFVVNNTTKQCLHYDISGSCKGTYEGNLKDPLDVAAVCTDVGRLEVFVTDHGQTSHGIKVARLRTGRTTNFEMLTSDPLKPMGITVTKSKMPKRLDIFISDASDKLIKVYSDTGELRRKIGQKYSTLFRWPLYLAIFRERYLAVTDNCLQTVFIVDIDTENIPVRIKHDNISPSKVCVLPDGSILIGDSSHQFAHKTTPDILSERRKNREIESTIPFPSEPITVAANSDYLCAGCKDGNILVIPFAGISASFSVVEGHECFV